MTTKRDLQALLHADLTDRYNRLVLADCLEDLGRFKEAARARSNEPVRVNSKKELVYVRFAYACERLKDRLQIELSTNPEPDFQKFQTPVLGGKIVVTLVDKDTSDLVFGYFYTVRYYIRLDFFLHCEAHKQSQYKTVVVNYTDRKALGNE